MKRLFCLGVVLMFSLSFARVSSYHAVVVSPVESYIQKKQLEFSAITSVSRDTSLQWKRRHQRRKKTRRPQRGR